MAMCEEPTYYVDRSLVVWEIGKALIKLGTTCPIIEGHKMVDLKTLKYDILSAVYGLDIHTAINAKPEYKNALKVNSAQNTGIGKISIMTVNGRIIRFAKSEEQELYLNSKRSNSIDKALLEGNIELHVIQGYDGSERYEFQCRGEVVCNRYCCEEGCPDINECEKYKLIHEFMEDGVRV